MFRKKVVKPLASLKLAVFVIAALAVLTAVGTFVEARYDLTVAAKWVYKTPWMYSVMALLSINLTAVMVDRWPWKKRHIPFVLAHIGILILLLGSLVTMFWGLDGTMRVGIGQSNNLVTVPETDLQVWSSFDGDRYSKVFEQEVDFFLNSPKDKPLSIGLVEGDLKVVDYWPFALSSKITVASEDPRAGAGIRFQLSNANVNLSDWLVQTKIGSTSKKELGPATVHLGPMPKEIPEGAHLFIEPRDKGVFYFITKGDRSSDLKGTLNEGQSVSTGWMGLEFKLIRYMPKAEEKWDFKQIERPTPLSNSVIKITFNEREHWVQLNDVVKLFTDNAVYILTYGNRRIDLGFPIFLKKFEVGRYQGTMRAASYQSLVTLPEGQDYLISMNEPLKYRGLTFYQASFQEAPDGSPMASILSVNQDPGRWIKYLGSLILSLGIVWLFYHKRKAARAQVRM